MENLTPEQIQQLSALQKKLDTGFVLVNKEHLAALKAERANMVLFLKTIVPIVSAFTGRADNTNIMEMLPQVIQTVQNNKDELISAFDKIAHLFNDNKAQA